MKLQDYIQRNRKPPALDEVVGRIREISTLPHIAMTLMQVANDPKSSALDLTRVVENDAALSARILRCVNSSASGTREKVSNLQQAISLLGLKQLRNLALTASVTHLFARDEAIGTYSRRALWQHLVAVGIGARMVAMRQRVAEFEDVFAAGLLHDIGIVLEDQYVHEPFREVIQELASGATLVETERRLLGFDHMVLGAAVAKSWRLPECIQATIGHHHQSADYRGPHLTVVRCVEVANLICTLQGYPSVGRKLVEISQPALTGLSLSREHLAVLAQDFDSELANNSGLFDL